MSKVRARVEDLGLSGPPSPPNEAKPRRRPVASEPPNAADMWKHTSDWIDEDVAYFAGIADASGCERLDLCLAVNSESAFRADIASECSSATGVAQWMSDRKTGRYLGRYTREELLALGLRGQLRHLRDRYVGKRGKLRGIGFAYAVIAAPAAVDDQLDEDEPIYARDVPTRYSREPGGADTIRAYLANPDWDLLGVGKVTRKSLDLCARAHAHGARCLEMIERVCGERPPWPDFSSAGDRYAIFGIATEADLKAWQAAHALVANGEVGPRTIARMLVEHAARLPVPTVPGGSTAVARPVDPLERHRLLDPWRTWLWTQIRPRAGSANFQGPTPRKPPTDRIG